MSTTTSVIDLNSLVDTLKRTRGMLVLEDQDPLFRQYTVAIGLCTNLIEKGIQIEPSEISGWIKGHQDGPNSESLIRLTDWLETILH